MTTFYLIRHGANDTVGHGIAGRRPGVSLNALGRQQVETLAQRLMASGITRVYCSPMERTRETAEPIAARLGVPLTVLDEVNEVEFGEWTGKSFGELEKAPQWRAFNRHRAITRIPAGESMLEVQARMVAAIERLRHLHAEEAVAIVSHGDPIRAIIIYYAGIAIDMMHVVHIDLASVSVIAIDEGGAAIRCLNYTGASPTV